MKHISATLLVFTLGVSVGLGPEPRPRKLALLVGIDHYRNLPDLHGSVNDVSMMKDLLTKKFGFSEEDILMLTDEQATRASILTAFRTQLVEKARPQDTVVFHFSGHGSQMRDRSGDEPDGRDETLVPHDSRDKGIFDISDDETNVMLRELLARCRNVTFIFDSCYSGTGQKAGVWRKVLADERLPPEVGIALDGDGNGLGQLDDAGYVFLSACGADEVAGETHFEGKAFGALTFELVKILNTMEPGTTWQQIMPNLVYGVHRELRGQTPQLQGLGNRLVFGVDSQPETRHLAVLEVDGDVVTLSGGLAHGLTKGSTFDVFPSGKTDRGSQAKARVELVEIGTVTAKAKILDSGKAGIGDWAMEHRHRFATARLKLHLAEDIDKSVLQPLHRLLEEQEGIQVVDDASEADLRLHYQAAPPRFIFQDGEGRSLAEVAAGDGLEDLGKALVTWVHWFAVLAIQSQGTSVPNIQLSVYKTGQAGAQAQADAGTIKFKPGEKVTLQIKNQSRRLLYFTILALDQNGQITEIYPGDEGYQPFIPGKPEKVYFDVSLSPGTRSEFAIFKAFATLEPIHMAYLTQAGIRSATAPHPLEALMAPGSRGGDLTPETWAVAQIRMVVER